MSNSKLATVTLLSKNHSGTRTMPIDRITPHCFVGQVTAKRGCEVFRHESKKASCNYVVGYDGSIGLCVDEANRSWCTSSSANDQRAITIEVASETVHPYAIRDAAYDSLKALIIDIMKRAGKSRLVFINDKDSALAYQPTPSEMLITMHRWFANKACPGDHIISIEQDLTDAVNRALSADDIVYKPMYRVQVGAFTNACNANNFLTIVKASGFTDAYINTSDGKYMRVQVGAFRDKNNALKKLSDIKAAGFDAYIKETEEYNT